MFNEETTKPTDDDAPHGAERNMAVTPLDVRQAKFGDGHARIRPSGGHAFLAEAADGYEQALRENERLRQEIVRLEGSLSQFRDLEGSLKSTLLSAQRLADDMRENAAKESVRIVRDAEEHAEVIVQKAHAQLEGAQREIDGL